MTRTTLARTSKADAAALLVGALSPRARSIALAFLWRCVPRRRRGEAALKPARRYAPAALRGLPRRIRR
ncbi:MAG: hypothetical protein AB7H93_16570 [Vicinamibacterales bacterium]